MRKLPVCIVVLILSVFQPIMCSATPAKVVDRNGTTLQSATYYPYGEPVKEPTGQPYLFGGKERIHAGGRNVYEFGARNLTALGRWTTIDPKAESFYSHSPYSYCGGDPVNRVDMDGCEWTVEINEDDDYYFKWVEHKKAIDKNGNLLPNHYVQAITFSKEGTNGTFNENATYNIGTSTATVHKADGTTENFDACTNPSDPIHYPTVPPGEYEAKLGIHKGKYWALRMADVATKNFYDNKIELGEPNKAYPDRTNATGINIHKAGINNYTGPVKGGGVSEGCLLIDRNKWNNFIGIFNTPEQKNNIVGIIILR